MVRPRFRNLMAIAVGTAVLSGCAAYPRTPRLTAYDLSKGYRFEQLPLSPPSAPRNSDELFVMLAFSGGGTRAASLSYGVLAQLQQVKFNLNGSERTLLDEVDVISSVSGGSFTAAYYALHGSEIFNPSSTFHRQFLYYPVQRDLLARAVYHPTNWLRLRSRVEIAANGYANNIFGHTTFAALQQRSRPYVILNATDASTGTRFEFTQEQFDLLCADLSAFPIARAVAASSAFPGLLNSMTIDSYNDAKGCGYTGPGTGLGRNDWVTQAMDDAFISYRRYTAARQTLAYRDPKRTHLHLLDGGLADNIGLRSVLQSLVSTDRPLGPNARGEPLGGWSVLSKINNNQVKTIVVITVNARTNREKDWDTKRAGPGTFTVISSASGIPMGNFSTETLELLREYGFDAGLNEPGEPRLFGVEVAFENIQNVDERKFLSGMGTNFDLAPFEVNCLIDRGALLLRESSSVTDADAESFQSFVKSHLKGTVSIPPVPHPASCTEEAGRGEIKRNHYIDIGVQYNVTRARGEDVDDTHGVGLAVRVTKPDGIGFTAGFGTESFDVPGAVGGADVTVGQLALRTLSGGVLFTRRAGPLEASAGLSAGYGFGGFTLDRVARDRYGMQGFFGLEPDVTNTWVLKPSVSLWFNLNNRWATTVSASYVTARPTIKFGSGLPDRQIKADAFGVAAGVGFKVF
jgi:NTE family protein